MSKLRLRRPPRVFRNRNFAWFMAGCSVSNIGSWMQNITVPFVIYRMTGSAAWVGVVAAMMFLPAVPLAPIAGALADRCDRRHVLMVSQVAQATCALGLWLTWLFVGSPWPILLFVSIGGTSLVVSSASQQAFVSDLVPQSDLLSALTMNSAQANLARAVGPALGGIVIAVAGPSWAFLLNALSFVAVLVALGQISVPKQTQRVPHEGVLREFLGAVRFSRRTPGIAVAMLLTATVGATAYPIYQLSAVLARRVYEVGPGAFGLLAAAFGVGALVGAAFLSSIGSGWSREHLAVISLAVLAIALVGYGLTPSFWSALAFAAIVGGSALVIIAVLNTAVQTKSDPSHKGKVIAVWIVAYNIAFAIGALIMGVMADRFGPRPVLVGAGVVIAAALAALLASPGAAASLDGTRQSQEEALAYANRP
jgi:predicted MFS family arabinose efflux permease